MAIRPLPAELQKVAEDELNEDPSRTEDDLKHIKDWLEKQPHLKIKINDHLFLTFLRGCKFSLQRTKEKLDNFYTIRNLVPEFFAKKDPLLPEIQDFLDVGAVIPLPNTKDSVGPRVYLLRWGKCDVEKMTINNYFRTYLLFADLLMEEDDNSIVSGIHIVLDLKEFSPNYILQLTPTFLKRQMYCLETAYPTRIKGVECINIPSVFEIVFNLFRTFMSEKLKTRFRGFSTENMNEFYKHVPQELLPNEYGGKAGAVEELALKWKKKLESSREWFLEQEQYGTVESLRPGKPKTSSEMLGIEGAFRKMNVD